MNRAVAHPSLFLAPIIILFVSCQSPPAPETPRIQTTDGLIPADTVRVLLPHEHIFTDLRGPTAPGYGQADPDTVARVMRPLLVEARARGVDVLVECTTIGVGRNVPIVARLARETGLKIIVPTGVYGRARFAPETYRNMTPEQLTRWMVGEIREGIEDTDVKAGFIKIASSEMALTPLEEKFLRAAARATRQTGVVIASHTTSGVVATRQVDILDQERVTADRFIWVHAQAEPDLTFHRQLAARGAYIELDNLGASPNDDPKLIATLKALIDAGHARRVLLSHDAGWYDPGKPNGGKQRPYTYLLDTFLPKLRAGGFDEQTLQLLTRENPLRAFSLRDTANSP